MGSLIRFPQSRRWHKAREEACYWLVSLDEGLSDSERLRLAGWLEADPSHADALLEMARQWDEETVLSELSAVFPLQHTDATRRRTVKFALVATSAALILATLCMVFIANPDFLSARDAPGHVGQGTYRTAIGEQLSIRLVDGSAIALNTDTSLQVDYSADKRTIVLHRGEASFEVAKDVSRPFEVHVGRHVFRALGTVFNVRMKLQNDIELMVNEGRVAVTAETTDSSSDSQSEPLTNSTTELGASEMAIINQDDAIVRDLDELEIEAKLAWKRGELIFRGEPLQSVIEDVSRYTTTQFFIADDSIRDIRVGGYFRINDIDGLLLALEESFGVRPTWADENLVVLRKL